MGDLPVMTEALNHYMKVLGLDIVQLAPVHSDVSSVGALKAYLCFQMIGVGRV